MTFIDDVIKKTAKDLNLPVEQVDIVIKDLFRGIKDYIREYHTLKRGVLLPVFRIEVRPSVIYKEIKRLYSQENLTKLQAEKLKYWTDVLDNLPWNPSITKQKHLKYTYDTKRIFNSQGKKETKGGQNE